MHFTVKRVLSQLIDSLLKFVLSISLFYFIFYTHLGIILSELILYTRQYRESRFMTRILSKKCLNKGLHVLQTSRIFHSQTIHNKTPGLCFPPVRKVFSFFIKTNTWGGCVFVSEVKLMN